MIFGRFLAWLGDVMCGHKILQATLMHVADTLALCRGVKEVTIYSDENCERYHTLGMQYLKDHWHIVGIKKNKQLRFNIFKDHHYLQFSGQHTKPWCTLDAALFAAPNSKLFSTGEFRKHRGGSNRCFVERWFGPVLFLGAEHVQVASSSTVCTPFASLASWVSSPGLRSICWCGEKEVRCFHLFGPWRGREHMEQPHDSDIVMTCLIPIWLHLGDKPCQFLWFLHLPSSSMFPKPSAGRIFFSCISVFYRNHPHLVTTGR